EALLGVNRDVRQLVVVSHVQNLLPIHLAHQIGVALSDMLLDLGDKFVVGFSFNVSAALAMDDSCHRSSTRWVEIDHPMLGLCCGDFASRSG
ncbi:MAG TPA: hypothetical protein VFR62_11355, partial [Gemmatimonadales bacterium]|nr:hypothetical protein [Gemmatimonadales bacterium]